MSYYYTRAWGEKTVLEFVEKYGRATRFLGLSLGIPEHELIKIFAKYICGNQNRWERVKFIVKDIEKHVLGDDVLRKYLLIEGNAFTYYTNVGYLFDDCWMDQPVSARIRVDVILPMVE